MMLRSSIAPEDEHRAPPAAYSDYDPLAGVPEGRGYGRTREDTAYDPLA